MTGLTLILFISLAGQEAAPSSLTPTPERHLDLAPLTTRADPQLAAEVTGIFSQVFPHWNLRCDDPQFVRERIQFDVALDRRGRIVAGPDVVNPKDDAAWRATAESARIALIAAAPFVVPEGYSGGQYRPTFNPARACAAD